jgi:hypothetical protein
LSNGQFSKEVGLSDPFDFEPDKEQAIFHSDFGLNNKNALSQSQKVFFDEQSAKVIGSLIMFPLTDVVEVHSSKNLFETEQP